MVTLVSQNLNEFELHLRAILGLPIPAIELKTPSASAVILADRQADRITYTGVDRALSEPGVDVRLFGKETSRPYRRMGVALAIGETAEAAREKATRAAGCVQLHYGDSVC
jgi:phosphoribosylglycinamide formyltransferase 2